MKKKKLKGMTLMEIIVAMAVLIITSGILVECGVAVVNNVRVSRTVVTTVNQQAPEIENRRVATPYAADNTIHLSGAGLPGVDIHVDKYEATVTMAPDEQRSGNMKYFVPAVTS